MDYALCEPITAGAYTYWHIRPLTAQGKKLGGGADTLALCGRKMSWDLKTDVRDVELTNPYMNVCPECTQIYQEKETK